MSTQPKIDHITYWVPVGLLKILLPAPYGIYDEGLERVHLTTTRRTKSVITDSTQYRYDICNHRLHSVQVWQFVITDSTQYRWDIQSVITDSTQYRCDIQHQIHNLFCIFWWRCFHHDTPMIHKLAAGWDDMGSGEMRSNNVSSHTQHSKRRTFSMVLASYGYISVLHGWCDHYHAAYLYLPETKWGFIKLVKPDSFTCRAKQQSKSMAQC